MNSLVRDGVRLAFEDVGEAAAPAIVFVHGWTCDRTHFAPQIEHLAATHRCVSVDLRGHGGSDAPQQDYTIECFADDVAWMCDQLEVPQAVLVGHSMGGAVVLEVAHGRPDLARAVALLDPAILFPPDLAPVVSQLASAFAAPDGMDVVRQFESDRFFLPTSDAALKKRLVDAACRTPHHVVGSAFRSISAYDAEPALAALAVPLLYVGAEPRITDVDRLRKLCPRVMVESTVGAGHFHQLEAPEQVNASLDRFLSLRS